MHAFGAFPLHFNVYIVSVIFFFEVLFADLQLSLFSMRKPLLSNFLLFVRAASWVPVFIAVSFFAEAYRTVDFLFVCWLVAIGIALIVLYLSFRHVPLLQLSREKIDVKWIRERMKSSWLIYISDLGGAGFGNVDRFLLASLLGLYATGIYSFYWSLAYGLQILVQAAIVQISLPKLVTAYSHPDIRQWKSTMKRLLVRTVSTGAVLAVVIYAGIAFVIPYLDTEGLTEYPLFFPLLLVASILKLAGDMLHHGLYSRKLDKALALINISALAAGIALSYVFITWLGLIGVCVAMITLASGLIVVRGYMLMRDVKRFPAVEQV
jgi:O-antigen/teichoic acid export membrane protein